MTGSASMVLLDLLELASSESRRGRDSGEGIRAWPEICPGAPGAAGGTVKGPNMPNVYCRGIP